MAQLLGQWYYTANQLGRSTDYPKCTGRTAALPRSVHLPTQAIVYHKFSKLLISLPVKFLVEGKELCWYVSYSI